MKKVATIVVTFNRKEYLTKTIPALLEQDFQDRDIIVIDNASTDGTAEAIKDYIDDGRIVYRNTGANLGGAGGFNYGMRYAAEAGYAYLWIMDDDCIPEPDALSALMKADSDLEGHYGFLSSIAFWRDGSPCNMNIQKTGLKTKITDYSAPYVPVIMATFVSAFFPLSTIQTFGLPIKDFFIWSDDLEYTRRISRELPCYAVNTSRVLHDMKSNAKVNIATDSAERLPRYRLLYRNEMYVYRREGFKGWMYLITRLFFHTLKILTSSGEKGKRISIIWKSFFSGFGFRPAIEYVDDSHRG